MEFDFVLIFQPIISNRMLEINLGVNQTVDIDIGGVMILVGSRLPTNRF